jgi:Tfp pilus assembly protein PilO
MPRILISAILIGLSIFLAVIFLWPRYQEFHNLLIQIENKEQEIQYQAEYYQALASVSEKLKEHQAKLEKIDLALPTGLEQSLILLKLLQKIASENGLILTSISPLSIKPLPQNARLKEIQGTLELTGSYPALRNFLRALEKSARLIEVDNISFSTPRPLLVPGGPEVEASDIFNFQLAIRTKAY